MKSRVHTALTGLAVLVMAAGLAACSSDQPTQGATPPTVLGFRVEANPNNVLSCMAVVHAKGARRVAVRFWDDGGVASLTPEYAVAGDSAVVPVVGMRAESRYRLTAVASSDAGADTSDTATFASGPVPADMPAFSVTSHGTPSSGYAMFGITAGDTSLGGFYAIVCDNNGRVAWYRRFATQVTDFQRQPNGHFTVFSSLGQEERRFYELDLLGNVVGQYSAPGGMETGAHELRLRADGYVLLGLADTVEDLTALGGLAAARVKGIAVNYVRPLGTSLRWWSPAYLTPDEAAQDIPLTTPAVNPWHANAIDVDADGHLLVSFRNSDMVLKINSATGDVIWRLGGKHNQFTFQGDPLGGFSHQHGIRRLANGNIILFDNGNLHNPPESRAVEYRLNESTKTAEMVWQYRHSPPLYAFALGFAHRQANGNTLITYGTLGRLVEVDAGGSALWELSLANPAYLIYRAFRIESLY